MEAELADGRDRLLGDPFTMADACYAPFVARLGGLTLLPIWFEGRP